MDVITLSAAPEHMDWSDGRAIYRGRISGKPLLVTVALDDLRSAYPNFAETTGQWLREMRFHVQQAAQRAHHGGRMAAAVSERSVSGGDDMRLSLIASDF